MEALRVVVLHLVACLHSKIQMAFDVVSLRHVSLRPRRD
jgi:hypothetical protein